MTRPSYAGPRNWLSAQGAYYVAQCTPEVAATLYAEAIKRRELPAWIVFQDEPDCPGKVIARLAIDMPISYELAADTLTELRAMLPPGLTLTKRQPADPPERPRRSARRRRS